MRVDLGNGQYADLKDLSELKAGDRRAVNAATEVRLEGDGADRKAILPGDMDDNMRYALLARIITAWNLQWPIPSASVNGPVVLDNLTFEQLDALYTAVKPYMALITGQAPTPSDKGSDPTPALSS